MNKLIFSSVLQKHISGIVRLVQPTTPIAIVLGGSYAAGEQCRLIVEDRAFYLSDFDVFVLCRSTPPGAIRTSVYRSAIELAESVDQQNPYFHIGLKFRSPSELQKEAEHLYYWELLDNGVYLDPPCYVLRKPAEDIFACIGFPGSKQLDSYLLKCSLTRLWCNLLFFPVRLLSRTTYASYRLWYSYFLCRGAMDWVTFRLLSEGVWASTYRERFRIWRMHPTCDRPQLPLIATCYEVRTGKRIVHPSRVIGDIMKLSFAHTERYARAADASQIAELQFLSYMSRALLRLFQNRSIGTFMRSAADCLHSLTRTPCAEITSPIETWCHLRRCYSDYRLRRSSSERCDHAVNTERFLQLGDCM